VSCPGTSLVGIPGHRLHLLPVFGAASAFDGVGLVVVGGVEDEFVDQCFGVAVWGADVEVVDEHGDFGAASSFARPMWCRRLL
jgi:hypothetical protein